MARRCIVPSCREHTMNFSLPQDERVRRVWLERSGISDWPKTQYGICKQQKICPKHFAQPCYAWNGRLSRSVLPSLHLPAYVPTGTDYDHFFYSTGCKTRKVVSSPELKRETVLRSPVPKVKTPERTYSRSGDDSSIIPPDISTNDDSLQLNSHTEDESDVEIKIECLQDSDSKHKKTETEWMDHMEPSPKVTSSVKLKANKKQISETYDCETTRKYDATDQLFLAHASMIKTFSPRRQIRTKSRIAQIIMEEELLHLEATSRNRPASTDSIESIRGSFNSSRDAAFFRRCDNSEDSILTNRVLTRRYRFDSEESSASNSFDI